MAKIIDFEFTNFVKLILVKNKLNIKKSYVKSVIYVQIYLCKRELYNKF
jgi:hypothetical protein